MKLEFDRQALQKALERRAKDRLRLVGEFCAGSAKLLAPVDEGNLRSSIDFDQPDAFTVRVGASASYAPYVEFGTGIHAENGKGRKTPWMYEIRPGQLVRTRGNKAQPFLRPAVFGNKNAIRRIVES